MINTINHDILRAIHCLLFELLKNAKFFLRFVFFSFNLTKLYAFVSLLLDWIFVAIVAIDFNRLHAFKTKTNGKTIDLITFICLLFILLFMAMRKAIYRKMSNFCSLRLCFLDTIKSSEIYKC